MKINPPQNESYSATVVTIGTVRPIEGADRIAQTTILGFNVIISADTVPGTRGIFFTPETQLSYEFAYENNLHSHGNFNKDEGARGYLGDNRRLRSIRLRGAQSFGLFMGFSSLSYIKGLKTDELTDGTVFDTLGDHEICNKYVVKRKERVNRVEKNKDKFIRIDKKFLPEHYDSDQWYRHSDEVADETPVIVTQKLHGTSVRIGHTYVARHTSMVERILLALRIAE